MAGDFEDTYDLENLSDRELRDLVREHLEASTALDIDDITVRVEDGCVILEGRVGDAGEEQVAEHVLTDVLGITNFQNNLVADENRRAESPEAIDDHRHRAAVGERALAQLRDRTRRRLGELAKDEELGRAQPRLSFAALGRQPQRAHDAPERVDGGGELRPCGGARRRGFRS